jgi:chromosome segregation ATPase
VRWIVRLPVLVLLVVVALRLQERQEVVASVDDQLFEERQGIARAEGYVDDLDARIDDAVARLRDLDARVSAFEARHADGVPAAEREEYEQLVGRRNEVVSEHNDLIARRRSAVSEYSESVGRYNARVEDANEAAEASAPWRVVRTLWASVVGASD